METFALVSLVKVFLDDMGLTERPPETWPTHLASSIVERIRPLHDGRPFGEPLIRRALDLFAGRWVLNSAQAAVLNRALQTHGDPGCMLQRSSERDSQTGSVEPTATQVPCTPQDPTSPPRPDGPGAAELEEELQQVLDNNNEALELTTPRARTFQAAAREVSFLVGQGLQNEAQRVIRTLEGIALEHPLEVGQLEMVRGQLAQRVLDIQALEVEQLPRRARMMARGLRPTLREAIELQEHASTVVAETKHAGRWADENRYRRMLAKVHTVHSKLEAQVAKVYAKALQPRPTNQELRY